MDNTEAIKVLEKIYCTHGEDYCEGDCLEGQALSLAIQALKPLPTLEELERVIDKVKLEGMLHILPDDRKKLATAILDLLKGER